MISAGIIDVAATTLSADEKSFFKDANPWAFILFGRSCQSPEQILKLTDEIRNSVGRDCLIFLDQEGGRVQRLKPPIWPQFPPNEIYGKLYKNDVQSAIEAVTLHHQLIAHELRAVGIDADCAPCLDLGIEGAHSVIGDRAFSNDANIIAQLGRAAMNGLHSGGVASVIKHIPGHGRALADSHHELPVIDADAADLEFDIAAFTPLNDAPMAMTAHVLYPSLDEENCATLSKKIISEIIRGKIGFDGLLMTDDVSMKALVGSNAQKAQLSIAAGCDVAMLCNQSLEERAQFIAACGELSGKSLERANAAQNIARNEIVEIDLEETWQKFSALTGIENGAKLALAADPTERL
jgi:beta-N-acetylhexosaminidase